MKIVFASQNKGKIRELSTLLQPLNIEIIVPDAFDIEETGLSFVENAILKARHACAVTGLPAIADDSGLEVFALNGAPGIYSARYAGTNDTKDNIKKLLKEMEQIPEDNRQARFYCALVFMLNADDPTPLICEASWHGRILLTPSGEEGFGYDPVFFDEHLKKSAAEISIDDKNRYSHRGQALRNLVEKLPTKWR